MLTTGGLDRGKRHDYLDIDVMRYGNPKLLCSSAFEAMRSVHDGLRRICELLVLTCLLCVGGAAAAANIPIPGL